MVTASPIDGFLSTMAEALNALEALFTVIVRLFLATNLDNILFFLIEKNDL